MTQRKTDVFISHASEDKDSFVRELAGELARLGLSVWYDEWTLKVGDNLRRTIDEGLVGCSFGVVVLSPHFLSKNWPQAELDGLFVREMQGSKVILPIYHQITAAEVARLSPLMATKLATYSSRGVQNVALEIFEVVRPDSTPAVKQRFSAPSTGAKKELFELLLTLDTAAPLLFKLDEPLSGFDAHVFLRVAQEFFHGSNLLTCDVDDDVRFGADNTLRVLASSGLHPDYRLQKLNGARRCFDVFRLRQNLHSYLPEIEADYPIDAMCGKLGSALFYAVEDSPQISLQDRQVLRICAAVLSYDAFSSGKLSKLPVMHQKIPHAFRDYLGAAFSRCLGFTSPDILDEIRMSDIKGFCRRAWEEKTEFIRKG